METTVVCWDYIGIMDKKSGTTSGTTIEYHRDSKSMLNNGWFAD